MTSGYSHNRFLSDTSDDVVLTNAGNVNLDSTLTTSQDQFTLNQEIITKKYADDTCTRIVQPIIANVTYISNEVDTLRNTTSTNTANITTNTNAITTLQNLTATNATNITTNTNAITTLQNTTATYATVASLGNYAPVTSLNSYLSREDAGIYYLTKSAAGIPSKKWGNNGGSAIYNMH